MDKRLNCESEEYSTMPAAPTDGDKMGRLKSKK